MEDHRLYELLRERAKSFGQDHIFRGYDELAEPAKSAFLEQLRRLNFDGLGSLLDSYINRAPARHAEFAPAETIRPPQTAKDIAEFRKARNRGEELLKAGKVAAFLVAGGQGTRLGLPGPKGTFPVYPISGKCLFEVFALKLRNLRARYCKTVPLFIMTNPENDEETRAFFAAFNFFGLEPASITFLQQGMLPCIDLWGKLVLDAPGHIMESPNGHGGALDALRKAGAVRRLLESGYEELFYFQVDNPMVRICDPVFVGFHNLRQADVSTKVVEKTNPDEKVGIVGFIDGKPGVIEYSELTPEQHRERRKDKRLRYHAGNTAIHVFSLTFLDNIINGNVPLPCHFALKKVRMPSGEETEVVKFERFIFDTLRFAGKATALEVDRAEEFSPLKNAVGADSPAAAHVALTTMWLKWLLAAGVAIPRDGSGSPIGRVEISPVFADSAEELKAMLPSGWEFFDGVVL
ncbi:MAG: UTP--glucose-1-phosphate uridylyltransferase [Candidatus Brocadiia bacterium]